MCLWQCFRFRFFIPSSSFKDWSDFSPSLYGCFDKKQISIYTSCVLARTNGAFRKKCPIFLILCLKKENIERSIWISKRFPGVCVETYVCNANRVSLITVSIGMNVQPTRPISTKENEKETPCVRLNAAFANASVGTTVTNTSQHCTRCCRRRRRCRRRSCCFRRHVMIQHSTEHSTNNSLRIRCRSHHLNQSSLVGRSDETHISFSLFNKSKNNFIIFFVC